MLHCLVNTAGSAVVEDARREHFRISPADYPQLKELAWHVQGVDELSLVEAHSIYERNRRFVDIGNLSDSERELIELLGVAFEGAVS